MNIVLIIILFGFIYGSSYFRFHEPYGLNNTYNALGYYMLSVNGGILNSTGVHTKTNGKLILS